MNRRWRDERLWWVGSRVWVIDINGACNVRSISVTRQCTPSHARLLYHHFVNWMTWPRVITSNLLNNVMQKSYYQTNAIKNPEENLMPELWIESWVWISFKCRSGCDYRWASDRGRILASILRLQNKLKTNRNIIEIRRIFLEFVCFSLILLLGA